MTAISDHHWFALVQAAPQPESDESVNVAVITGNGRPEHLTFPGNLPRLRGLVGSSECEVYGRLLEAMRERIESGMPLDLVRPLFGPQLRIMEPTGLLVPPGEKVLRILVQRFLETASDRFARAIKVERRRAESLIDRTVGGMLTPVGLKYAHRVRPKDFFPSDMTHLAESVRAPFLARGILRQNVAVLLDSVVLQSGGVARDAVKVAATRIGRAFWTYSQERSRIRDMIGMEVRTIGLVSREVESKAADVLDADAYIRHLWNADDTLVLNPEISDDRVRLREALQSYGV